MLEYAGESNGAHVVILYQGRILAEACFTDNWQDAVDVFAVQKGLISILIGIASEKGMLEIADAMNAQLGAGWS